MELELEMISKQVEPSLFNKVAHLAQAQNKTDVHSELAVEVQP